MSDDLGEKIALESAALRGAGNYDEAIAIVENVDWSQAPPEVRVPALIQAFYAAAEASMRDKAEELAARIAQDDPDIPSIQPYL